MTGELITKVISAKPGKTVAVFAGIHGNEKAGVMALEKVLKTFQLDAGTAYFVIANPEAVKLNVRFIEKNLNRLFFTSNDGQTTEDERARELMKVLDECDALLDLHGYNGEEDSPFIITDGEGLEVASKLDFGYIITGINKAGDGATDCYMTEQGKPGLCLECGSNFHPEKYAALAEKSIYQFLKFYGLVESAPGFDSREQKLFKTGEIAIRQSETFAFDREYQNFDELKSGAVFATDGENKYTAKENEYIIFPRPNQKIGQESFMLVSRINS